MKMSNGVLFQEIEQMSVKHKKVVHEMQIQMQAENEKWQQVELQQADMHHQLMDTIQKLVAKNKELKKEIEGLRK
jgi:hypothetical protein